MNERARMWQAQCAAGRTDEVVAWVRSVVVPDALEAGATRAEVFARDERVVLLTRWAVDSPWTEPAVPDGVEHSDARDLDALP